MIGSLKSEEARNKYVNSFYNGCAVFRKVNVDGTDKRDLDIQELVNIFGESNKK